MKLSKYTVKLRTFRSSIFEKNEEQPLPKQYFAQSIVYLLDFFKMPNWRWRERERERGIKLHNI